MKKIFKTFSSSIEVIKNEDNDADESIGGVEGNDDEGEIEIKFVISDESEDRHGDVIKLSGWNLEDYKKNPIVAWAHDTWSKPPVGKAKDIMVDTVKNALVATVVFPSETVSEFGHEIGLMYKYGFLNAVSVGFTSSKKVETDNGYIFEEQSLHEFSCVPVPANTNALAYERSSSGIDIQKEMLRWATEIIKNFDSDADIVNKDVSNDADSSNKILTVDTDNKDEEITIDKFKSILSEAIANFKKNIN